MLKISLLKKYFAELSYLNFRLHAELKEVIEKQLDAFPFVSLGTDILADEYIVENLQEQLKLETQVCEIKQYKCFTFLLWLGSDLFIGSELSCSEFLDTLLRHSDVL